MKAPNLLPFLLLQACSWSFANSASDDCKRLVTAIQQHEDKCHTPYKGEWPDCSGVIADDGDIDTCEAALAALPCDATSFPKECEHGFIKLP